MGFTKLDDGFFDSSLVALGAVPTAVFCCLLSKCGPTGISRLPKIVIAKRMGLTSEEADRAFQLLQDPDPDSRTPDHDGRRIERCDGGWLILNYAKYREFDYSQNPEAIRKRRIRQQRQKQSVRDMSRTMSQQCPRTLPKDQDNPDPLRGAADPASPSIQNQEERQEDKEATKPAPFPKQKMRHHHTDPFTPKATEMSVGPTKRVTPMSNGYAGIKEPCGGSTEPLRAPAEGSIKVSALYKFFPSKYQPHKPEKINALQELLDRTVKAIGAKEVVKRAIGYRSEHKEWDNTDQGITQWFNNLTEEVCHD